MSISNATMIYYDDRETYINGMNMLLSPLREFDGIEYHRKPMTNEEYIKISDIAGASIFLEVTGMSKAEILKDVARVILMGDINDSDVIPRSWISNDEKVLDVAELFRRFNDARV